MEIRDRMIDLKELLTLVPAKKATIYSHIKKGTFPKPEKLGRSSYWWLSDIYKKFGKELSSSENPAAHQDNSPNPA